MKLKIPETYYWSTEHWHSDNNHTMQEFIDYHLPSTYKVIYEDGTYAEIMSSDGYVYGVHVSGDGDCYDHKIEFEEI